MKTSFRFISMAAVALLFVQAPALASCGTPKLDGTWAMQGLNTSNKIVTVSGGKVMDGMVQAGTISQTANCKVTLTLVTPASVLVGWSDFVRSTSSRKPKTVQVGSVAAGLYVLVRQ